MRIKAKDSNNNTVYISIFNLNEFIHSSQEDLVFIEDDNYNQWLERKGNFLFEEIIEE